MKRFLLFIAISILSVTAWAQSQVSGKVTAADSGEPLEGATIMVKGMEAGALTDADGAYTVNVPAGGTVLVFTYTNRKTVEEEISGRNQINVAMAEDLMQTDVQVVTAIGISRQSKELGYSVQNVQGSALTNSR